MSAPGLRQSDFVGEFLPVRMNRSSGRTMVASENQESNPLNRSELSIPIQVGTELAIPLLASGKAVLDAAALCDQRTRFPRVPPGGQERFEIPASLESPGRTLWENRTTQAVHYRRGEPWTWL